MELKTKYNIGDIVWIWCYGYDDFTEVKINRIEIMTDIDGTEIKYFFENYTSDSYEEESKVFATRKEAEAMKELEEKQK